MPQEAQQNIDDNTDSLSPAQKGETMNPAASTRALAISNISNSHCKTHIKSVHLCKGCLE